MRRRDGLPWTRSSWVRTHMRDGGGGGASLSAVVTAASARAELWIRNQTLPLRAREDDDRDRELCMSYVCNNNKTRTFRGLRADDVHRAQRNSNRARASDRAEEREGERGRDGVP